MIKNFKQIFRKEQFKRFSLPEILIYTIIIVFLLSVIFLFFRGIYPEKRDKERIQDLAILEKALNVYFRDWGEYPEIKEWKCLERDEIENGVFSQKIKDYLPQIPQDPLFNPEKSESSFCYWYKTAQGNKEYKIYALLEKKNEIYQIYSPDGKGIYTGQLDEVSWFNPNWKLRKKITIDHTKVSSDLNNFPLLLYLKDDDLKEYVGRKGKDIIFVDSEGKKLKREIENYDSLTGELFAWVKIPFLSSVKDTEIYIYYSNPQTLEIDDKDTWDENFLMVQHLNGTSGESLDSTPNLINGEPQGDLEQGSPGKIDKCYGFDGIDDFVNLGNPALFSEIGNLTIEFWILPRQVQEGRGILGWEGTEYGVWQIITENQDILFQVNVSGNIYKLATKMLSEKNEWNHLTFVYDGKNLISYLNGERKAIKGIATGMLKKGRETFVEIGRYNQETWISNGRILRSYSFNGLIDEVRISNETRNQAWIKTSFENQNEPSSFIKIAQQELY
jgi:type II secretory pathway pseudopilin PulG